MKRPSSHLALVLAIVLTSPSVLAQGGAVPPPPPPPVMPPATTGTSTATPPAPAPATPTPATPAPATTSLGDVLTGPAKADYEAGALLFRDRDYAGALVKFQSAYDQSKEPRLFFNIGVCEKNMRHYARTISFFERYRAEAGASLSQADRDEVDRYLTELKPFVANLQVVADEPGATIYVDGNALATTPLSAPLRVDIGQRHIKVSKDGFADFTTDVNVTGNGDLAVAAKMEKITHEGRLVVEAEPGDAIAIDDQPMATGRFSGVLPSGGHQLKVTAFGKQTFQSEVLIQDKQTRTLDVKLEAEKGHGVPMWVWIGGGVLVAGGIAAGSYFALKPGTTQQVAPPGTMGTATLSFR